MLLLTEVHSLLQVLLFVGKAAHLLQYSGLENSVDYTVHDVAKSWTRLNDFHFHFTHTEQKGNKAWIPRKMEGLTRNLC